MSDNHHAEQFKQSGRLVLSLEAEGECQKKKKINCRRRRQQPLREDIIIGTITVSPLELLFTPVRA